jgi:hypothetical protein
LDSKEDLNVFKEQNFNKEDFELCLEIDNRLGSEIKNQGILTSMNFKFSERFKPFLNRKFGMWSKDSKFKPTALNQGHFKIQGKDLNFKRIFSSMDLNSIYFIELKGRF